MATTNESASTADVEPSIDDTLILHSALAPVVGRSGVDGIPAEYDDGRQWLQQGLRRQPLAVLVALFFAWTGFWLALWGAAVGAVLGAMIALGAINNPSIAHNLFGLGIGRAVTPLAIISGLVLGFAGGFVVVLGWVIFSNPLQWIVGMFCGFVVAVILTVAIAAFERLTLRLRGYRRLSRDEVRRVAPLVKDLAEGMDLDGLPRFAIVDSSMPGAWAHMRTIVIATGLLQSLDDGEIRAILAHELHHWRSGDSVGGRIIWSCAWPIAIVLNIGMFLTGAGSRHPSQYGQLVKLIGWVIAWPAWVVLKYAIVPVSSMTRRRYEYDADAAAGQLGYGAQLSTALRKMGAFETGRTGWERAMAATHPPTELRVEALQAPKPDDATYQEDELRGPSRAELKRLLTPFWPRRAMKSPVTGPGAHA